MRKEQAEKTGRDKGPYSNLRKYVPEWERDDNFEPAVIHPDITFATRNYGGTPQSFRDCFELRKEARQKGKKYWQDEFDERLRQQAEENTLTAACRGWRYPKVGER